MIRKKTIPTRHLAVLTPLFLAPLLSHCSAPAAVEPSPRAQHAIEQPAKSFADSFRADGDAAGTAGLAWPQ